MDELKLLYYIVILWLLKTNTVILFFILKKDTYIFIYKYRCTKNPLTVILKNLNQLKYENKLKCKIILRKCMYGLKSCKIRLWLKPYTTKVDYAKFTARIDILNESLRTVSESIFPLTLTAIIIYKRNQYASIELLCRSLILYIVLGNENWKQNTTR